MGNFVDYYRIVKPKDSKSDYVSDGTAMYNNYSWYTKMLKGSANRYARYQQYHSMDQDNDVSRALDTIAEEMSSSNQITDLPFEIKYQNEDNKEIDENITMTIRAALRHWASLHDLKSKTFEISRMVIKYGDCFFRKTSDLKEWRYVDPSDVIGLAVDEDLNVTHYHLRKQDGKKTAYGEVEVVPAKGILHFSLSSKMGDTAPFGDSVLRSVIKAYRQLSMLEDAVIIYRIVRAPERRVFSIAVGNMPVQKQKAYLEAIKNDVKQKRMPNQEGGGDKYDGQYNPMSMTEDYYFPVPATGQPSTVNTLPGGENLGEIADLNWFQSKFFRGLRIPTSYMRGSSDGGSQITDGKVGLAFIEELRFANYIRRLQNRIENVFDREFKCYLKSAGVKINPNLFFLTLPEPQNFADQRQAALDNDLLGNFNSVKEISWISPRFAAKRYLRWSEDDIQANESMRRKELAIPDGGLDPEKLSDIRMFYDPGWMEKRPDIKVDSKLYDITTNEAKDDAPPDDAAADDAPPEGLDDLPADEVDAPPADEPADKKKPDSIEDIGKLG